MNLETEPIGSIPRPAKLVQAMRDFAVGVIDANDLASQGQEAVRETIEELEATGSPVITDGEQTKPSFATYPITGLLNIAADGVIIPFSDGHTRQLPRLVSGPFHYSLYASSYAKDAQAFATKPLKQAVISASALALLYPSQGISGYPREQFIEDLIRETASDVRLCLDAGCVKVQMDFTEARLSLKLDPSGALLQQFIDLNNQVLRQFSAQEKARLGVHTCPGGDQDATHSADIDYAELLPKLFQLEAGNFYLQLASEPDRKRVLGIIRDHSFLDQKIFIGVTDPIHPRIEIEEEICEQILEATKYIPTERLGTTDDCGFAPFSDDLSTSRNIAFAKIRARVGGTMLASSVL
jgi:5-methyltetrahydropteroyltriglutamate--homocysteine methyltransferase